MALDFIAGCVGGCAGVVVGHPFDTVKVKLQTQDYKNPVYRGAWDCCYKILRNESVPGLYRGFASPMAGVALVNAMVFGVHGTVQRRQDDPDSFRSQLLTGAIAGLLQSMVASPVELIKTRMQTNSMYSSVTDCLKHTYLQGGFREVFKGLGITAIRDSFGYALYFATYKAMTQLVEEDRPVETADMLLAGGLSGVVSWAFTYPLDVIKTRLQADGAKYSGVVDCLKRSINEQGLTCLTRGLYTTLLRAFPTNAVTFTVVTWTLNISMLSSEGVKENINVMLDYLSGHPKSKLYCLDEGAVGIVSVTVKLGKQRPMSSDFWVDDGNIDYYWHEGNMFV